MRMTAVIRAREAAIRRICMSTCGYVDRETGCSRHSAPVPRPPSRPDRLRGKVFRGSDMLRSGRLTRAQLRSSAWQRLFPDVYACSSLEITHTVRAMAVSRLLLPAGVLCGRSAAVLWGVALADADDDVECVVPPDCRSGAVPGVRLTRRAFSPSEVTGRRDLRVTTPLRTALDLARIRPREEAVVALDRFLRSGLVPLADVRNAAGTLTGPGCRHVRAAADLADGVAESPQETRLRLLLRASHLPPPVAQHVVRDADGFVARVDFAWPELRLALEYDGAWHGERGQFAADRRRLNRLTAAGWQVIFVTAADLHRPEQLIARIRRALTQRPAFA
jgi:very-short-patch-repair endonuclease